MRSRRSSAWQRHRRPTRRAVMAFGTHHVHVKTRDPKQTMQFYVEHLGATLLADMGARGYRVNLHGLQLNITGIIDSQKREQHYGLEHIAVDTDDYSGTLAQFRNSRRCRPRCARDRNAVRVSASR